MSKTGVIHHLGTSLFYQTDDLHADAPWLVFSNSLLTDMHVWDHQIAHFADRFNILRYDQRGHGNSTTPTGPMTFDTLAGDAIAVMENCGVESATFIGLSMGTPTALAVYGKRPDLIKALVLCDGQAKPNPQGIALWDQRIQDARDIGLDAYAQASLGRWFSPDFPANHPNRAAEMLRMMRATTFAGFEYCVHALQSFDYSQSLAKIAVPTQIIVGADDGGLPTVMKAMQQAISNCNLQEVSGAGHIPNVEQPADFNDILERFLKG